MVTSVGDDKDHVDGTELTGGNQSTASGTANYGACRGECRGAEDGWLTVRHASITISNGFGAPERDARSRNRPSATARRCRTPCPPT
jgi:hypothetical protein